MELHHIPQVQLSEFVKSLLYSEGTVSDNLKNRFGVDELDLSNENLAYLSTRVFDCECCKQVYSIEFVELYNDDENWCKWCVAEEPIEQAFSEGLISLEEYSFKMIELSKNM